MAVPGALAGAMATVCSKPRMASPAFNYFQSAQEVELFWQDLGKAGLIAGTYPGGGATDIGCTSWSTTFDSTPGPTYVGNYLPPSPLASNVFMQVYANANTNYYVVSNITGGTTTCLGANPGIRVVQARAIDEKTDDGLPTTGGTTARYYTCTTVPVLAPNAATASSATCYDTTSNLYSVGINSGSGVNCGLMIKFQ